MINQSDLLRVSEKRVLVGRAIEDDDLEHIDHARDLLRGELEHLVRLIHDEIQSLRPAPHPMPEPAALDLDWWQEQADAIGEPILVLGKACSHVHGTKLAQRYFVVLSQASEWERMNALARVEPKVLPVVSESV